MKYLPVYFCISLSLGILFANSLRGHSLFFLLSAAGSLVLAVVFLKRDRIFLALSLVLFFCLGGISLVNYQTLARCHIVNIFIPRSSDPYIISGVVKSHPELKLNKIKFMLWVDQLQSGAIRYECCGVISVNLRHYKAPAYGDRVTLVGSLYKPYIFRANNKPNHPAGRSVYLAMDAYLLYHQCHLRAFSIMAIKKLALSLKDKFRQIIESHMNPLASGVLEAMILGDRRNVAPLVSSSMVKSGTVHILVVSGFNTSMVIFIVVILLKIARVNRRLRFFLALPVLIIYCLMAGASTPVLRATIMAVILMMSYLLKRQSDIYNSLALALLFILTISPGQLFDIGTQLSFMSVFSIVLIYTKIRQLLKIQDFRSFFTRFLGEGFLVSFSAWVGTAGIIAWNFRIISLITVFANIIIVPLAALITLCGFSMVLVFFICQPLAVILGRACELLIFIMLYINSYLIRLPWAYFYL